MVPCWGYRLRNPSSSYGYMFPRRLPYSPPEFPYISAISAMVLSGALPKYIIPEYDFEWTLLVGSLHPRLIKQSRNWKRKVKNPLQFLSPPQLTKVERICKCLQTLQSTSPSYLLLASLDAARAQLNANPGTVFNQALELAVQTKNTINEIPGISVLDFPSFSNFPTIDPLRLSIGVWLLGLSGFEADEILCRDYGVVSELTGTRSITLAITLGTCREHIQRLVSGLRNLSATNFLPAIHQGEKGDDLEYAVPFNNDDNNSGSIRLSPREAFFARKIKVSIQESTGEVCGELICPYPPGIPLIIPGELITEAALNYLLQLRRCKGAVISGAADPLLSSSFVVLAKKPFLTPLSLSLSLSLATMLSRI
ncbi:hypothetical protein RHMOL_Rhmol03G0296700 [Rhododendron molle]|uniref:Uncharacterized protein n=1 Tax=Rhododendron molle TaxID=49168 RepID=A0ACC0PL74_RHOML|nr:hypothetical protein RHMOL_Rhmol03G0296700 [Rhododendron molle]